MPLSPRVRSSAPISPSCRRSTLVVYARGHGAARLAWQVVLRNENADMTYMVDAHNGRILERWSNRHSAAATGTARHPVFG